VTPTDTTPTQHAQEGREGRTDVRPTDTRSGDIATKPLVMGDVCAVLGLSRDEVRNHVRMGRLTPTVDWGYYTWKRYSAESIAEFAKAIGRTPDWTKLPPTDSTDSTDSRVSDDASLG